MMNEPPAPQLPGRSTGWLCAGSNEIYVLSHRGGCTIVGAQQRAGIALSIFAPEAVVVK
jgi:hypothetical protein